LHLQKVGCTPTKKGTVYDQDWKSLAVQVTEPPGVRPGVRRAGVGSTGPPSLVAVSVNERKALEEAKARKGSVFRGYSLGTHRDQESSAKGDGLGTNTRCDECNSSESARDSRRIDKQGTVANDGLCLRPVDDIRQGSN
jgi:hypothetical protein